MKILLFHQYFLRPDDQGGSRFNEMARMWSETGHEVHVVAGQVSYCSGLKPKAYHGRLVVIERTDGAVVYRAYTPTTALNSFVSRIWAFFCSMISATLVGLFYVPKADLIIATSPPLTIMVPGLVVSFLRRLPMVFEVRDLWPESATDTGLIKKGGIFERLLLMMESSACRLADRINVLTPAFRENILRRGLAGPDKFIFIPNGADLESFERARPADRKELGWDGKFVVAYCGAHGIANHLIQFLEAAQVLKDKQDILFVTIGVGPQFEMLRREAEKRGLSNFRMLGERPKREMPSLVAAFDVGAAVLQKNDTFKTVYPNKIFDYFSSRKPALVAIDGAARKLVVDEARAGLYAEPENPGAIADAVMRFYGDPGMVKEMGERGHDFVKKNFDRRMLAERYITEMKGLVEAGNEGHRKS